MAESAKSDITGLLNRMAGGDKEAEARVIAILHPELKRLARACMRSERRDHTIQPTELVAEAYMRIVAGQDHSWENRVHFFAVAARIMRHFLVDYARARLADKRGGGAKKIPLVPELVADDFSFAEIVELDRAIDKYAKIDERGARVVELRFFAGMGVEETARVLEVAERTVKRDWQTARVWLFNELKTGP